MSEPFAGIPFQGIPTDDEPSNSKPVNIEAVDTEPTNIKQANIEQANIEPANIEPVNTDLKPALATTELKAEPVAPLNTEHANIEPLAPANTEPATTELKAEPASPAEIPQIVLSESNDVSEKPKSVRRKSNASIKSTDSKKSKKSIPPAPVNPYADDTLDKNGMPTWYNVGWTGFSHLPNPGDDEAMTEFAATHTPDEILDIFTDYSRSSHGDYSSDLIAQFIPDKFLGQWYFNCGVVFLAILLTWILTKCHLGLFTCLVVGSIFGKLLAK